MRLAMLLAGILTTLTSAASAEEKAATTRLAGDWVMELYIGSTVFADQVSVRPGTEGGSGGSLTVPGRFTAALQNVKESGDAFSFEITADEGRGPFHVVYKGEFHGKDDVFVGFATLPDEGGKLLGGFVGRRK